MPGSSCAAATHETSACPASPPISASAINWAWDIEDAARQLVEVERLLDHWRAVLPGPVLEISYEALVADMENESRRLIEFLGLDWDPACLAFHETERSVTTASALQVRQPILPVQSENGGDTKRICTRCPEYWPGTFPTSTMSRRWDTPEGAALRRATAAMATGDLALAIPALRVRNDPVSE